ncbi:MAG: IS5 family transposase [Gemmatimonadales bacterium]
MRGDDLPQSTMWSYVPVEDRIPAEHPLRALRTLVNQVLRELSPRFARLYPKWGRPSIPPEQLLRALLLQVLYTIRSERQLMEQLDYNLLYRWFVGLNPDDPVWDPTVFTKNRDRLLRGDIAQAFFDAILGQAQAAGLVSSEHFTVDGTLIQAWAGQKSFRRKDQPPADPPDDPGNPTVDFHGERRSNATHASTTDPDARLAKKAQGHEAKLAYQGHVLMENRHGLAVATAVTVASGTAERDTALPLLGRMRRRLRQRGRVTLGADKGYDTRQCVEDLRAAAVTPHVALGPHTILDGRTTRHSGYAVSQTKRKRVEEIFGWLKTVGLMRQTRHRGRQRVGWMFTFATAVYNLVRLGTLALVPA